MGYLAALLVAVGRFRRKLSILVIDIERVALGPRALEISQLIRRFISEVPKKPRWNLLRTNRPLSARGRAPFCCYTLEQRRFRVAETKGKSPFYPGQPVPVELFVGRAAQIDRILERGVRQVAQGKPVSMFIQGEYGIGKSSIAGFTQWVAERDHGLFGIYATLGSARSMDDLGAAVLEATVIPGRVLRSGALDPTRSDRIRSWLAKYVGEQSLFGITLHVDAVRKDAPSVTAGMLPFLGQVIERLKETGVVIAADEVGKKYVDQQVYKALHSSDYRSILKKIGTAAINGTFKKAEIAAELTETEKSKFNNFLQRMKQLRVIRSGQDRGEYTFNMRMVALYIFLESVKDAISPKSEG